MAHHVHKFGEVIAIGPKVIRQNAQNWANLQIFIVKKCWGTPVSDVMYFSKPWPFNMTCENL